MLTHTLMHACTLISDHIANMTVHIMWEMPQSAACVHTSKHYDHHYQNEFKYLKMSLV